MFASLLLATAFAATPADQDPASLLPADTLVFFGSSGGQGAPATAMDRILGEPEVKAFLEMPIAAVDGTIDQLLVQNGHEDYRGRLSLRKLMYGEASIGRSFLGLTHFAMDAEAGLPDVGLVVGLEVLEEDDLGAVRALWGAIPADEEAREHASHGYMQKVLANPGDASKTLAINLAFLDNMVVVSTSERSLQGVLERANGEGTAALSSADDYASLIASGGSGPGSSTALVRFGALMQIMRALLVGVLATESPEVLPAVEAILDGAGLMGIRYVGSAGRLDPEGRVLDTSVLMLEEGATGLLPELIGSSPGVDRAALDAIPGNVLSASVSSVSGLEKVYDYFMGVLERLDAASEGDMTEVTGMLDAMMGDASLRDDLLANVSGTAVSFALPSEGMMGQPAQVVSMDVEDPARFVKALGNMIGFFAETFGQPIALRTTTNEAGLEIHEVDVAALTMGMMVPAFAFEDQRMTMCLNSKRTLEDVLAGRAGEGKLLEIDDLADFVASHGGKDVLMSVSWADNAKTFGSAYGQIAMMGQMFGGGSDLPIDVSLLPSEQSISKHLRPSYAVTTRHDGRVVTRSVGQFRVSDLFIAALPLALVAGLDEAGLSVEPPAPEVDPREQALADMSEIKAAITIYRISEGDAPEALSLLVKPLADFPKGALNRPDLPVDPWGNDYRFAMDGRKAQVWSPGPNGIDEGGEGDDIVR